MNRKTIIINLTWEYLTKMFLENQKEIIELDLKKVLKKGY